MTTAGDLLRANMRHSITLTELQHLRVQFQVMAALLAGAMLFDLADPIVALLGVEGSVVHRAAAATALGPQALARVFLVLGVLLLPFLAVQMGAGEVCRRGVTQLACLSLSLTAVMWLFLAWRCIPLDLGFAPLIFLRQGLGSLLFAAALAWSLNAEQIRCALERP